ncbi:MBL fold metallo-hydrolase, partial [Deinococcus aquaticus]|uniref:ComEC/Rec2 family competence protein n=1 Tax=Deinococcus aquaticus TaxID=328692 RepID=UPI003F47E49C
IAGTFGQVPLVGLPANLVAGVIMAALVPLGFLAGLLGPVAAPLNLINGPLASALLLVAQTFGQAPVLTWGVIGPGGTLAFVTAAAAGWLWLLGRAPGRAVLGAVLAGTLLTALPGWVRPAQDIVFLDVGQGDCTLLRLPGLTVLIDAGGSVGSDYDVGGRTVVPALRALGVRKLDVVIATHADTDHIEGVSGVLRALPVGELWIGQRKTDDPVLTAVLNEAQVRGVPVREVRRGDRVQAGRAALTVLWPPGNVWSTEDNDNSVAVRLDVGDWHAAFLGDLPAPAEAALNTGPLNLLKAAHHGSRYSTGEALLAQARPTDAVISVGRNTYGHPHPDVLGRLAASKTRTWRTDQSGTITWPLP